MKVGDLVRMRRDQPSDFRGKIGLITNTTFSGRCISSVYVQWGDVLCRYPAWKVEVVNESR